MNGDNLMNTYDALAANYPYVWFTRFRSLSALPHTPTQRERERERKREREYVTDASQAVHVFVPGILHLRGAKHLHLSHRRLVHGRQEVEQGISFA
jgi:hypothetical protein